jgi:drug/metabolite transporter (DMT)-like permease
VDEINRILARERQADLVRAAQRHRLAAGGATSDRPRAATAAALVTVVLWGSAFVVIRGAASALSPGALALGRLVVSVVALSLAIAIARPPLPARRDLLPIAAYGVLFLGGYSVALNAAERRVDAGTAAMLINIGPVLIAVGAGLFLHEGFPRWLLAGCGVALAGCVLIGLSTAHSSSTNDGSVVGISLLLFAAMAYASAVIIQKPVLARVAPLTATWLGNVAGLIACLAFAPALLADLHRAGPAAIGPIVYLGLGPTALGFATYAYALRRMSAGAVAALAYLIPVVAIVLGWVLLAEMPPALAIVGGALCLTGVAIARR